MCPAGELQALQLPRPLSPPCRSAEPEGEHVGGPEGEPGEAIHCAVHGGGCSPRRYVSGHPQVHIVAAVAAVQAVGHVAAVWAAVDGQLAVATGRTLVAAAAAGA